MKNNTSKFMEEVARIKDPMILIGVARILKVQLVNDDKTHRDFVDVFQDIMDNYASFPRNKRRELLKILKNANKDSKAYVAADPMKNSDEEVDSNADNTSNTEPESKPDSSN